LHYDTPESSLAYQAPPLELPDSTLELTHKDIKKYYGLLMLASPLLSPLLAAHLIMYNAIAYKNVVNTQNEKYLLLQDSASLGCFGVGIGAIGCM
jgi:hypothetical protein